MQKIVGFLLTILLLCPLQLWGNDESTSAELKIISALPQGDLNSLDDAGAITLTFNHPVVSLSGIEKDVREGPLEISPTLPGKYRWMGSSTLRFLPDEKPLYGTRYMVTVNAPIQAVGGETMSKAVSFSFVTPRPKVRRSSPYQDQEQVTLEPEILLLFDQPMNPETAAQFAVITGPDGHEIPVTASFLTEADDADSQVYWADKGNEAILKFIPQQPLKQESRYTFRIKAGLPGKQGSLGMKNMYELPFRTYNHLRAEGIEPGRFWFCGELYYPEYGVRLAFSNPIKRDELLKYIRFTPEVTVPEEESYEASSFNFESGFQPNTHYTLTLSPDLPDKYGNILGKEANFEFTTVDFGPYMEMPFGRMISEAYLGLRFPIKIMNVFEAPFKMKAYRTPESMLEAVKKMSEYDFDVIEADVDRDYRPDILTNKLAVMPFDLGEVLHEGEDTGMIGLDMSYSVCNGEERNYKALIFLTNLSVTAKFSAINNLFWVTHLKDSTAVKGAEVELYDMNQKFLWKGETDAEGFLETPGWKELGLKVTNGWSQPWVFAVISSGDDRVVIHSRDGTGIWPYRFGIDQREDSEHFTNTGYIFTERGLYRPGEEVRVVGILRDKVAGELQIPKALKVTVKVSDPEGKNILEQEMTVSDFGSLNFPIQLDRNAKLGQYTIECKFPLPDYFSLPKGEEEWVYNSVYGNFKVEMYRPVEFEVGVDFPQSEYIKGDTAAGDITGNYLFGGPLRNVPVEWNLSRNIYYFSPETPELQGYSFNSHDRDGAGQVAQDSGTLDEMGEYRFDYLMQDAVDGSFSYSLDATVTDSNSRRVSNRQSLIVHGGEYYIGLKPSSLFASTDEGVTINTLAISPEEELLPGREYQLRLKRVWWESVRRAGNGGRLYWETEEKEELVQTLDVVSGEGPVQLNMSLDKVGYYSLEAVGTDSRGNTIVSSDYFYAVGSGYAAWKREDDDYVEIVPNAKAYQPGDTASILVKSPYEKVKALVTIEREGILERWVENIEGSADTIEIPIKPEYIPNVYVGVILIQERVAYDKVQDKLDLGKPGFKIGYTNLPVNPAERHLQVKVGSDQKEYRPGTEVEVQLQVSDADGVGKEAEVALSVVDVGVLNLTGYATPDPFDYFYRPRPLGVLSSELRNSIVGQRNYSQKGERAAGGGMDAEAMMQQIQLREKFRPSVYHNPEVRTDAEGRAVIRFTLPDNLSSFRIMATAHTKDAYFGAGDTRIKVNKNLMLTASLPAFLRIGDNIQAGVLAHNRSDAKGVTLVQTEVHGVELASADSQEVSLPAGDKQEVLFNYTAEEEGDATLIFKGRMEEETDGLKVTLPVLLHRLPLSTALFGSTVDARHEEIIEVPQDALPGWGEVRFSTASTIFTDIKSGVEFLFSYPYGCLEQKISKILPIVLAEPLVSAFDIEVLPDTQYHTVVQDTLDEFSQFQHENGGYGYWKAPFQPSPFVSAYAVFAMAAAKKAGYTVDEESEAQAVAYLEKVLKGQNERETAYRYNNLAWNASDAFMLYALTLYDKYQPAYATRLYEMRDQLPVFGKALLLKAVHAGGGDSTIQDSLREELLNSARIEASSAYFDEIEGLAAIHSSNVRSTAVVSQALMDVDGNSETNESFIPKAIQWLLRQRKQKSCWRTTQENFFTFWALSTYLNNFEGMAPDFTAAVLVNSREIFSGLFQGRETKIAEQAVLLDEFKRDQPNAVEFVKNGEGRLYYNAVLTYLPDGPAEAIDYGIAIEKSMTVVKGKGKGSSSVYRGDVVKIDLTVTTPSDRLFVVLDDPLPAGFKALDFGLQTTDRSLKRYLDNDHSFFAHPFLYSEYKDDRVVFYADNVPQGVHTISYLVSAEHSGSFNLPPTFASEMYAPEVFGMTGADMLEVK
ncbi:hypothetical protein CSB45_06565 [candidate division KSB3 bacterium]|uniref:Alpha-2-macroglobulin n=1 Tax=candidate division KSB3 bacterium TaxID=2044937 RepID=A0A2G6E744_9BACT|nr:MAG: hypothetical protein CSB45_06565 [candidate division KSB3 bacterium]PIE30302.1 MAG: hypothetical protein CSA57_05280 [candidate division KSB3 bacterium]